MPRTKGKPNPIDEHVGSRVRIRRTQEGMSQTRLADSLGITFQQIQKYEKGTNRISASKLQLIARILKVPVQWFFEGAPGSEQQSGFGMEDENSRQMTKLLQDGDTMKLVHAFAKLQNRNLRKKVLNLVRALAGEDDDIRTEPDPRGGGAM
jgi:transcriptional regulator with XRE-family HTH domain